MAHTSEAALNWQELFTFFSFAHGNQPSPLPLVLDKIKVPVPQQRGGSSTTLSFPTNTLPAQSSSFQTPRAKKPKILYLKHNPPSITDHYVPAIQILSLPCLRHRLLLGKWRGRSTGMPYVHFVACKLGLISLALFPGHISHPHIRQIEGCLQKRCCQITSVNLPTVI